MSSSNNYTPTRDVTLVPDMRQMLYDVQLQLPRDGQCVAGGVDLSGRSLYTLNDLPYGTVLYAPSDPNALVQCNVKGKRFVGLRDANGKVYNTVGANPALGDFVQLTPSFQDYRGVTVTLKAVNAAGADSSGAAVATLSVSPGTAITSDNFALNGPFLAGYGTGRPMQLYTDNALTSRIDALQLQDHDDGRTITLYTAANPLWLFRDGPAGANKVSESTYAQFYVSTKKGYEVPLVMLPAVLPTLPATTADGSFTGWREVGTTKVYRTAAELRTLTFPANARTFEPVYEKKRVRVTLNCSRAGDWTNPAKTTTQVIEADVGTTIQLPTGSDLEWCMRDGYVVTGWNENAEKFTTAGKKKAAAAGGDRVTVTVGGATVKGAKVKKHASSKETFVYAPASHVHDTASAATVPRVCFQQQQRRISRLGYLLLIVIALAFFCLVVLTGIWGDVRRHATTNAAAAVDNRMRY